MPAHCWSQLRSVRSPCRPEVVSIKGLPACRQTSIPARAACGTHVEELAMSVSVNSTHRWQSLPVGRMFVHCTPPSPAVPGVVFDWVVAPEVPPVAPSSPSSSIDSTPSSEPPASSKGLRAAGSLQPRSKRVQPKSEIEGVRTANESPKPGTFPGRDAFLSRDLVARRTESRACHFGDVGNDGDACAPRGGASGGGAPTSPCPAKTRRDSFTMRRRTVQWAQERCTHRSHAMSANETVQRGGTTMAGRKSVFCHSSALASNRGSQRSASLPLAIRTPRRCEQRQLGAPMSALPLETVIFVMPRCPLPGRYRLRLPRARSGAVRAHSPTA